MCRSLPQPTLATVGLGFEVRILLNCFGGLAEASRQGRQAGRPSRHAGRSLINMVLLLRDDPVAVLTQGTQDGRS